jgi:hypothetical protein
VSKLPLLLTRVQASELLGVSSGTFNNWVNSGTMPDAIPGTGRWSRVQLERAASGQEWVPAEPVQAKPLDPYEDWKRQEAEKSKSPPHSYGNLNFNPEGPLGKREVAVLLALHGRSQPLKEGDIHGASVATIEKLGLRGYLVESGHFYKLLLTKAGQEAADRLARKSK